MIHDQETFRLITDETSLVKMTAQSFATKFGEGYALLYEDSVSFPVTNGNQYFWVTPQGKGYLPYVAPEDMHLSGKPVKFKALTIKG